MKFGATIKKSLYPEWQTYYINYSGLKKYIKRTLETTPWNKGLESAFVHRLELELEKVSRFQENKVEELTQQIAYYEDLVKELVDSRQTSSQYLDDDDEENTSSCDSEIEDRFLELEEELETLVADVHDLSRFTHLNYTGFIKIVKKHDKQTGFQLRGEFMRAYMEKRPFFKENFDSLIVHLSRLYNLVRTRGNPIVGDSSAGGNQSAFVRQTTKYWVHPDNYVDLKLAILKHLPVLVFDPNKKFEPSDSAISSIYFDNPDLNLYLGRLEKTDGAQAIRLRWYGPMDNKQIFVERKTHREDWTGEKSVKARFPIKEHQVNDYLSGKLDMSEIFEKMRGTGKKSDKDIDSMITLAREVQEAVHDRNLQPVVRTYYQRTAFQLPGDARVRISFDTNLALVREDDWDGKQRCRGNWRRKDIGIDWPFDQLEEDDRYLFPYGVLEVKLQTQHGQEPPEWVKDLVSSHLVEAVPKFSKFLTGCAQLLPHRVTLVPFWIPQMDCDIRKLPADEGATKTVTIARPTPKSLDSKDSIKAIEYTEPVSDEEGDDRDEREQENSSGPSRVPSVGDALYDQSSTSSQEIKGKSKEIRIGAPKKIAADETLPLDLPPDALVAAREAKEFREREIAASLSNTHGFPQGKDDREEEFEEGKGKNTNLKDSNRRESKEIFDKLTPENLQRILKEKRERLSVTGIMENVENSNVVSELEGGGEGSGDQVEFVSHFRAAPGKLVAVPVRVEPKVYMANERTFLAWLEFAVIVSAIGVGLLNFASPDDPIGLVAGALFTGVALIAIAYSGAVFYWRAFSIRKRMAIAYDDRYGPSILCGATLTAVIVNFVLRATE